MTVKPDLEKREPATTQNLTEQAKNSKEKEAYQQLEKTQSYRIGVGARTNQPTTPSFFVEIIINLSTKEKEVNLQHLEKMLTLLKALKNKGYTLTYEDNVGISCEMAHPTLNLNREYQEIRTIIQEAKL